MIVWAYQRLCVPITGSLGPISGSTGPVSGSVGPTSGSAGLVSGSAGSISGSAGPISGSAELLTGSAGPVTDGLLLHYTSIDCSVRACIGRALVFDCEMRRLSELLIMCVLMITKWTSNSSKF